MLLREKKRRRTARLRWKRLHVERGSVGRGYVGRGSVGRGYVGRGYVGRGYDKCVDIYAIGQIFFEKMFPCLDMEERSGLLTRLKDNKLDDEKRAPGINYSASSSKDILDGERNRKIGQR